MNLYKFILFIVYLFQCEHFINSVIGKGTVPGYAVYITVLHITLLSQRHIIIKY